MVNCSVPDCKNKSVKGQKGVTFHSFPKDEKLCKLWIDAIGREKEWSPSIFARVCSIHFSTNDFDKTGALIRLKKSTIPSIKLFHKVGSKARRKEFSSDKDDHYSSDENRDTDIDIKEEPEFSEDIIDEFNKEESSATPAREMSKIKSLQNLQSSYLQKVKQINNLNQTIFRTKRRVSHLMGVLKDIKRGKMAEAKKYNKFLILREKNTNAVKNTLELKAFAVTLHFLSDKAYNYVHSVFKTTLPPEEELYKWRLCFEKSDSEEIKDIPHL